MNHEYLKSSAQNEYVTMDGPENYKTPELLSDLVLKVDNLYLYHPNFMDYFLLPHQVQDHMFLVTGETKYRSNPLIGAPDTMVSAVTNEKPSL